MMLHVYYVKLFDTCKKSVRGSEQSWWDQLSIEYMSYETSYEEEDAITVHLLPWRSQRTTVIVSSLYVKNVMFTELNDFLGVLNKRADEVHNKLKTMLLSKNLDGI